VELLDQGVDVIVTSSTQATRAAKEATATIPIVMANGAYPDKIGLVDSLARPGGNVTGMSNLSPQLLGKRLELLKEAVPKIARVAVLMNSASPIEPIGFQELLAAAAVVGLRMEPKCETPKIFRAPSRALRRTAPMRFTPSATPSTSRTES
jgi:putative ABC transport system substrate-binding protein